MLLSYSHIGITTPSYMKSIDIMYVCNVCRPLPFMLSLLLMSIQRKAFHFIDYSSVIYCWLCARDEGVKCIKLLLSILSSLALHGMLAKKP